MRSYLEGEAYAKSEHLHPSRDWHNKCQMFARSCVGAAAWAPSARQAANAIPLQHRHTSTPPPGALVYYGSPVTGYGHVTKMSENGKAWSNDIVRDGKIDLVPWKAPVYTWGLQFRFWTDWTPSGRVNLKPVAPAKPAVAPFPGGRIRGSTPRTPAVIAAIKEVQRARKVKVDGIYGPVTQASVMAWKRHHPWIWPFEGRGPSIGPKTYRGIVIPK